MSLRNYAGNADIAKDSVCKPMLKKWSWLDLIAIGLIFFFIVLGELIWIPDPLKVGPQIYWIELIDELVYACLIPPLLWGFSACLDLHKLLSQRHAIQSFGFLLKLLALGRILGLMCSIWAIYIILFAKDHYLWLVISIAGTWALSLISIHLKESSYGIPKRSLSVLASTILLLILLLMPTHYLVTYPGLTMNMNEYAQV